LVSVEALQIRSRMHRGPERCPCDGFEGAGLAVGTGVPAGPKEGRSKEAVSKLFWFPDSCHDFLKHANFETASKRLPYVRYGFPWRGAVHVSSSDAVFVKRGTKERSPAILPPLNAEPMPARLVPLQYGGFAVIRLDLRARCDTDSVRPFCGSGQSKEA
jgi:hypothetical protein